MTGNESKQSKRAELSRRKLLIEEYKNRKPEMGVISARCIATGEVFLAASKDTSADFNSLYFKLSAGGHPNKRLQTLWQQYGKEGFVLSVVEVLKYEDPQKDHSRELEKLYEQCLLDDSQATKIWR